MFVCYKGTVNIIIAIVCTHESIQLKTAYLLLYNAADDVVRYFLLMLIHTLRFAGDTFVVFFKMPY